VLIVGGTSAVAPIFDVIVLRHVSGMELHEVADACEVSLATVKRRLQRAEEGFAKKASKYPAIRSRLWGGRLRP
jgi:predicted RNA polymerase sigma factor